MLARSRVLASSLALSLLGLVAFAPVALANEPIQDGQPLSAFIAQSTPEWNFARANNNDTCWPATAIDANGAQHAPAARSLWPVTGSGCQARYSPFTTYVSAKSCSATEIRVSYTLYWPKDGFAPGDLGHDHDFEYIAVVWNKGGTGWTRDRLLMSRHGKNIPQAWSGAESWNADFSSAGLGREYPRVFVGWGKHAMFNNQGGLKDVLSQFTDNEYRHADFRVNAAPTLQEVTENSTLAQSFDRYNWGHASSNPAANLRNLCSF